MNKTTTLYLLLLCIGLIQFCNLMWISKYSPSDIKKNITTQAKQETFSGIDTKEIAMVTSSGKTIKNKSIKLLFVITDIIQFPDGSTMEVEYVKRQGEY